MCGGEGGVVFHLEVIWSTILPWYAVVSVGSVGGCSLQVTRCRTLPEALVFRYRKRNAAEEMRGEGTWKHAHLPGTPRREGSKQFREAFRRVDSKNVGRYGEVGFVCISTW